jgi:hypothetical protein
MLLQKIVGAQYSSELTKWEERRKEYERTGTLDLVNARDLGINLEKYKKIKDDPRIVKALKMIGDLEINKVYTSKNQELDHLSFNTPIPDLVKQREEEQAITRKKIVELVKQVEKDLEKKTKAPQKPKTHMTRKSAKDSDLSSFQAAVSTPDQQAQELQLMKSQYEHFMNHRDEPEKITNVVITGLNQLKMFEMVVTREGKDPKKLSEVSVHRFGFSEHKEMVPILKAQPKDQRNQSWLKQVQQRLVVKQDMELKLGIGQTSKQTPEKRKATEDASGSRPTKK